MQHPSRLTPAAGPAESRIFGLAAALLLGLGLTGVAQPARAASATHLALSKPWIRAIMPGVPAAGYFTLFNNGDRAVALVAAASPACGKLMLHRSETVNGVERMVMVTKIPVPAHGRVAFAPGGYHLMCMSPSAAVRPGAKVPVTLKFADGATLGAEFPVRGPTGK